MKIPTDYHYTNDQTAIHTCMCYYVIPSDHVIYNCGIILSSLLYCGT